MRDDWDDDDDDEEEEQVEKEEKRDVNGDTKATVNGARNDGTASGPGLSGRRGREIQDNSKIWEEA